MPFLSKAERMRRNRANPNGRPWTPERLVAFLEKVNDRRNSLVSIGAELGLSLEETRLLLSDLDHPRANEPTHANSYTSWTLAEVDKLLNFLARYSRSTSNLTMEELGSVVGRSGHAVQMHLEEIGLLETSETFTERIFKGHGDGNNTASFPNGDAPCGFQRWTPDDEDKLLSMFRSGSHSMRAITSALGRTANAIIMHMEAKGYIETRLDALRRLAVARLNPSSGAVVTSIAGGGPRNSTTPPSVASQPSTPLASQTSTDSLSQTTSTSLPSTQMEAGHIWTEDDKKQLKQLVLEAGSTENSVAAHMGCSEPALVYEMTQLGWLEEVGAFGKRVFGTRGDGNQTGRYIASEAPNKGKKWFDSDDALLIKLFGNADGSGPTCSLHQITERLGRSSLSIIMRMEALNCFDSRFEAAKKRLAQAESTNPTPIGIKREREE